VEIAVVGGTGVLGAAVTEALERRGHSVRVLSRRGPYKVDLHTGAGLVEALTGVDAAVDASNSTKDAPATLIDGTRRLLTAEAEARVGHHVLPSIVGIDRVPTGYFKAKLEQERIVRDSSTSWSILRATQFHQLLDQSFAWLARRGLSPRSRILLQPIDPREVAHALAENVEDGPSGVRGEVGGPEILTVSELARIWSHATERHRLPVPLPLVGRVGRQGRNGALTVPESVGALTFAGWLTQPAGHNLGAMTAAPQAAR